jgi:hypothetical protein
VIYPEPQFIQPAQLKRRSSLVMLFALVAASLMGFIAWGPVELTPRSHWFADQRTLFGISNAINVLSHVPLIPLGIWGLWRVAQLPQGEPLRMVWALFFASQMLATVGGMAYHLAPSDHLYVWEQLPKSAACTFMACAFLAEWIDLRWAGVLAMSGAVLANITGAVWWVATLHWFGAGDLRPLLWLEFMPTMLVATGAWNLAGRVLGRQDWQRSLISFVVAQFVDWADPKIFSALGYFSGHSVRHLALASCVAWLAYRLGRNLKYDAATTRRSPRMERAAPVTEPMSLQA